jgi:hypothetical protein
LSTPVIEWLYSATTKMKPSKRARVSCQRTASGFCAGHPAVGGHLVEERQRMVAQVDQLDVHVAAGLGLLEHPLGRDVGEAGRAGGADDDGDAGFGGHDNLGYAGFYWKPDYESYPGSRKEALC